MSGPPELLILFHSQSGNTQRLAAAVETGALRVDSVNVRRIRAALAVPADLLQCACIVICSPEYFGYMAGAVKDFFDRTYEAVRLQTTGKPYAVIISAGNDGSGALSSIQRIVAGYNLRQVQEPCVIRGEPQPQDLDTCRILGETLAAGIDLGIY